MNAHLLLIALGPVQVFIAQARRTRDLWHGSQMISELSRAAACSLGQLGARLLIPALDVGDVELQPCWTSLRPESERPAMAIANKIWALLPTGMDPAGIVREVRAAVLASFRDHAEEVREKYRRWLPEAIEAVWDEQVDDAVELVAGWIPLDERPFADLRATLDDAVASRKRLRDFQPWRSHRPGARKSSLDGGRASVLPFDSKSRRAMGRQLALEKGEELDAIGLVKRAGAHPGQFTPIVNVALAPWLRRISEDPELESNYARCRAAFAALNVQRLQESARVGSFPFEASVLLPDRWSSYRKEQGHASEDGNWRELQAAVSALRIAARAPRELPYVACLVADGDRMGKVITRVEEPEQLRRLSAELSSFAGTVREIVRAHDGSLVYAGGDDVLAFLPVDRALACASVLRLRFAEQMGSLCAGLGLSDEQHPPPTLSVGLGIGHFMASMGDLLELGRDAEALAKGSSLPSAEQRNALAIIIDKRSGGRRAWRSRWDAAPDPAARLAADFELLELLSVGKIHAIDRFLRELPEDRDLGLVLEQELRRFLARNEGGALRVEGVGLTLPADDYQGALALARAWVERVLIARELRRLALLAGAALS